MDYNLYFIRNALKNSVSDGLYLRIQEKKSIFALRLRQEVVNVIVL